MPLTFDEFKNEIIGLLDHHILLSMHAMVFEFVLYDVIQDPDETFLELISEESTSVVFERDKISAITKDDDIYSITQGSLEVFITATD